MKYALEQIQLHFYQFYKCKKYLYMYLLLLIITCFGSIFFIYAGLDTVHFFSAVIGQFGFFLTMGYCIICYLYFIRYFHIKETIFVITQQRNEYLKYALIMLLILMFIFNICLFVLIVINVFINDQSLYFFKILPISFIMNIFLPQFVSLCIVYLLSNITYSRISYVLFLLFVFISSPYGESFVFNAKPYIPIDQIYYFIRLPFSYFIQNGNVSIDILYGFQNETFKIYIFLFWICVFLSIYQKNIFKKHQKIISFICLSLGFVHLFMAYQPQSLYRPNGQWDKNMYDYHYYIEEGNGVVQNKEEHYKISEYKLNIHIAQQLYVKGSIHLESEVKQKEYVLTLYQKYHVQNLSSSSQIQSYQQNGDYIHIYFQEAIDCADINIEYNGYHDNLYSNYQAILLPGYFAWYPMAGEKILYSDFQTEMVALYGYNATNSIDSAYFDIQLQAHCQTITNLKHNENNHYEGYTNGLTIIGGMVEPINDSLISNRLPLMYNQEEMIKSWKDNYYQTLSRLKTMYGLQTDFLENKKIIVVSNSLTFNVTFGGFSVFQDHLFVSENHLLDTRSVFEYLILKDHHLTLLKEQFMFTTDQPTATEFLSELNMSRGAESEELSEIMVSFQKVRNKVGDENMLKELTQYVIGNTSYQSDIEFLKGVMKKYD